MNFDVWRQMFILCINELSAMHEIYSQGGALPKLRHEHYFIKVYLSSSKQNKNNENTYKILPILFDIPPWTACVMSLHCNSSATFPSPEHPMSSCSQGRISNSTTRKTPARRGWRSRLGTVAPRRSSRRQSHWKGSDCYGTPIMCKDMTDIGNSVNELSISCVQIKAVLPLQLLLFSN